MKKKETLDEAYLHPMIEVMSVLSTQVLCQSGLEDYNDEGDIPF